MEEGCLDTEYWGNSGHFHRQGEQRIKTEQNDENTRRGSFFAQNLRTIPASAEKQSFQFSI